MNDKLEEFDQQLDRLFDRLREGTAEPAEVAELERRLRADSVLRQRYRSRVRLEDELTATFEQPTEMTLPFETGAPRPWYRRAALAVTGLAAAIAVFVFWPRSTSAGAPEAPVATLENLSAARWERPPVLAEGSRVAPGEVRLESGTARFRFDSGAIVSLEGPASLVIDGPMKARLTDGKALVEVPEPEAQGFVLELPHGQAVDLGTRFSAIVDQDHATCEVLEGRVLMRHTASRKEEQLADGQVVAMSGEGLEPLGYRPSMSFAPQDPKSLVLRSREEATVVSLKWQGKDIFHEREQYVDDRMLLVKMEEVSRAQRRALFNIDLRGVRPGEIEAATLNLNLVPSGLGFAAYLPETVTFAVYGVTDEARENWPASAPRWEQVPGYVPDDPAALNPAEVTLLGKFKIERGQQRGRCTIETPELRDFLRADTTGEAGFLIVRETYGTGNYSLVHAFASSRHPEASGPSLEVVLSDD